MNLVNLKIVYPGYPCFSPSLFIPKRGRVRACVKGAKKGGYSGYNDFSFTLIKTLEMIDFELENCA
jgi:hypothetical protein